MKLPLATFFLTLGYTPSSVVAQTCSGVSGPFTLTDITKECNYATILDEYTRQVFDVTGSTCVSGSDVTAKEDLDAKLTTATGEATGEEAAVVICEDLYNNADVTAFTEAANKGSDLHFEQEFYNGGGPWQEEVETIYESDDRSATSVLRRDAAKVREFYEGRASYSRVDWPNSLTNFDDATCTSNAAMCCWPKDRQANDGNGNCATPYDVNCVDKDPADNTDLCFADMAKGNLSTELDSDGGFMVFPGDGNDGEGAIHCHGFAWENDEYASTNRYKANNLFFVSMYDHMHQRGYVKNIPGQPMCGCIDQMPLVTRSDCTQVDLTEDWEVVFDGVSTITTKMIKVEIDFNACQGRGGRANDLWTYVARLYDEEKITAAQFGKVGRVLTNDDNRGDCYHATEFAKYQKGYVTGYTHDADMYTQVAGRDDVKSGEPFGREAFNKAFFEQSLTAPSSLAVAEFAVGEAPIIMRICPSCRDTHKKIWYRRKTPIANINFDLLHNILYYSSSTSPVGNIWNVDFSLHSSYEDADNNVNPWLCPNNAFDARRPFVGKCSPDGTSVDNQYSIFSWHPGPRPNVAYYINKPDNTGVQDYSDNVDAVRAIGFSDVDIGNPSVAGNTWEDTGVYHVTGGGNDIWSRSDQFHFKSQTWSGDIDVSVNLSSFANNGGNQYAKAGIMLRSDNSPDATYAFAMLTGSSGIYAQHRRSKGMSAGNSGSGFKTSPAQTSAWLRIVKKQEKIEFYRGGAVPGEWILLATDTILFPDDSFRVGLAVCGHGSVAAEATFENYVVEGYSFPTSAPSISMAPTAWEMAVEIGDPQMAGSFYASPDTTFDYVKGSGTGIWGSSDSFFFYNEQRLKAGMSVEMYIQRFDNSNIYSRGGIMIRDNNDADAANAFVGAAGGDQGAVFQSRASAGANTIHHKMIYANSNNHMWVKLDMDSSYEVTASYKVDEGDAWIELGSIELTLSGTTVQVGQAVTSGRDYKWALDTMESKQYSVTV